MTHAQHQASDPASSVWVSASAGTGKTKVLTDRVLRLLLGGTPPGKILCLTYTNAAAAEMANRVHRELQQWVTLDEKELVEKKLLPLCGKIEKETIARARRLFAEVLDTPDGLKIQTIHAFCQTLMRRFPLEAGIAPHFQVIDEQTANELLKESWLRLLTDNNERNEHTTEAIRHMSTWIHEYTLTELMQEIVSKRGKFEEMRSRYTPHQAIERIRTLLGVSPGETEGSILHKACLDKVLDKEGLRQACAVLQHSKSEKDVERGEAIARWLAAPSNQRVESFESYALVFLTQEYLPRVKVATNACKAAEPLLRQEQERIFRLYTALQSLKVAEQTAGMIHIADSMLELYRRAKHVRAFLDYSDLILTSGKLLSKAEIAPWILYKLDGGIDHLLVDEAQDTSPEQWQVVATLCEEFFSGDTSRDKDRTIFVVGDEKQSIYRFQGADPTAFGRMQSFFSGRVNNAGKAWRNIALDRSFRSTEAVLQCVDAVFAPPQAQAAISTQAAAIRHDTVRSGHPGCVELWPLLEVEKEEELTPWQLPLTYSQRKNPKKQLAEKIAETIGQWLAEGRMLPSKDRKVEPGDIMVLVRRRDTLVDALVKSLKKKNIPVAGVDRMVLTDHLAVMDLIALGNFLLLPQDDLMLATVLKTPFIGLAEEELFEMAYGRGKQSLWENLKENHTGKPAWSHAYSYLSELLAKTDFIAPFELYSYILDVKGGRKNLMERLGEEINDPVDEFLVFALQYEQSHPPSLQGFLHWVENGKTQIKRDLDQGQNEVRIMTAHGAKGLQAPIIFLPDTTQTPSFRNRLLWMEEDVPLPLWVGKAENENDFYRQIRQRVVQEEKEESLRLLYVALTRAEDELYITGYKGAKNIPEDCWYTYIEGGIKTIATEQEGVLRIKSGSEKGKRKPR